MLNQSDFSQCCALKKVQPLKAELDTTAICVEVNDSVEHPEFLETIENNLKTHDLIVSTYTEEVGFPSHCKIILSYIAFHGRDFVPFLGYAKIKLHTPNRQLLGYVEYAARKELMKWGSAESKLSPLLDELLKNIK